MEGVILTIGYDDSALSIFLDEVVRLLHIMDTDFSMPKFSSTFVRFTASALGHCLMLAIPLP